MLILNGSVRPTQSQSLSGYLAYYGLIASAPNTKADTNGVSGTRIVVYNGAEADLTETIAFRSEAEARR